MRKCPKWVHCHGAGGSGGGGISGGGIALVVLLVAAAAVLRAAWSALMAVGDVIAEALEIVALVLISALGAAALGALGYGAFAVRRRVLAARRPAPIQLTAEVLQGDRHTLSPGQAHISPGGRPGGAEMPAIQGKRPVSATGAHLWAVPDPADREGAKW